MGRILSIWLPQLPLDRLIRHGHPHTEGVFAVTAEQKNATRLTHLSLAAQRGGLTPGLTIPDARAICPGLLTEPADPYREAQLLRALGRWADQLSPRIALDEPDGLFLDITGCAHLFGGEEKMGTYALDRLKDMQIIARIGIADTKGAAQALARFSQRPVSIAPAGRTRETIDPLPIAALRLPPQSVTDLAQAGLKTIGQLYAISSAELARRFGLEMTKALGCSTGTAPDPISPATTEATYAARMTLPDPIGYIEDLENVLQRLGRSVCTRLEKDQKGARRFELTVRCVDTGDHVLTAGFARPCFNAAQVLQQFARPLDELKIEFGADWFRLAASHIEPIRPSQVSFERQDQAGDDLDRLITTLGNRLGFDHVRRFSPKESHLPETEFTQIDAIDEHADTDWRPSPRRRPVRLLPVPARLRTLEPGRPPKRFEWHRQTFETKSATGPERLTPEWWHKGDMRLRDYWTVQTQGPRLWLLTYPGAEGADWYVAGQFS